MSGGSRKTPPIPPPPGGAAAKPPPRAILQPLAVELYVAYHGTAPGSGWDGAYTVTRVPVTLAASGEASQRMKAANHMRQLGIALHNYHFQENAFPTIGKGKKSSWCHEIAVYVELDPKAADFEKTPASVFYMPTRRKPALYNELPKTDFAGCTGNCDDPGKPDKEGLGAFHTTGTTLEKMTSVSSFHVPSVPTSALRCINFPPRSILVVAAGALSGRGGLDRWSIDPAPADLTARAESARRRSKPARRRTTVPAGGSWSDRRPAAADSPA